ncbi:MAG TPA: class I lanthipeptide [Candidatus Deferrimicrobium sp.]|nr:class I lanthipeptide [Candidatus Deferrimicrobium sp.]
MKKQKKFERQLSLNKVTISTLEQQKVVGGATLLCPLTQNCTNELIPCPCEYPITY